MKNTIKKVLPLVFVVFAGIVGGILRGMELTLCYDDTTGLYTSGPVTYFLLGLSTVIAVLCLLLALMKIGTDGLIPYFIAVVCLVRCSVCLPASSWRRPD